MVQATYNYRARIPMATSLTILAPTHNRPNVLNRVWTSWLAQEGLAEIVIVDDGSDADYEPVFAQIREACSREGVVFKSVRLPQRVGAPAAKNAGLSHCTSDEVLTTDDDIQLAPDLVSRCRRDRPIESKPVIAGPRVIYLEDGETVEHARDRARKERAAYFDFKRLTITPWANPERVTRYPFVTAVALWPRSLFADGLRFFEGYGGNGYREETDPQLSAQTEFGASVYLTPDAECFHLPSSVAYSGRTGQRRGGVVWYEFWVLRNNAVFLKRFGPELRRQFKINPWRSWASLAVSRVSPARFLRLLNRMAK